MEEKLHCYMKENKIKKRSVAIKQCIEEATSKETTKSFMIELDKKLNRILYRQNLNRKILEQLFTNMDFGTNMDVETDLLLKKYMTITMIDLQEVLDNEGKRNFKT